MKVNFSHKTFKQVYVLDTKEEWKRDYLCSNMSKMLLTANSRAGLNNIFLNSNLFIIFSFTRQEVPSICTLQNNINLNIIYNNNIIQ